MAKVDDEFILANFGAMSQRKIAKHFKVSPSTINRHVERLGLKGRSAEYKRASKEIKVVRFPPGGTSLTNDDPGEMSAQGKSHLERLYELCEILFGEIQRTEGSDVARLSKEYRAVLDDISALERSSDGQAGESSGLADLISCFQGGLPAADVAAG